MHPVAGGGSLRWWPMVLALGLLVAVWCPGHSTQIPVAGHGIESAADWHDHDTGQRSDEIRVVLEAASQEPRARDDHRCGPRGVEQTATLATSVPPPRQDTVTELAVPSPPGADPRPATADPGAPRAPPAPALLAKVCVWRQ